MAEWPMKTLGILYLQFSCKTLQLRNYFFEPQHKKGLKTIRLVRLMNGEYNPGTFLKQLIPFLSMSIDIQIKIGFSFIGVQNHFDKQRFTYFFAAQDLCTIREVFHKREEMSKFADQLEKQQYDDFLQETFLKSQSGERFIESGIRPLVLVACYTWIRK